MELCIALFTPGQQFLFPSIPEPVPKPKRQNPKERFRDVDINATPLDQLDLLELRDATRQICLAQLELVLADSVSNRRDDRNDVADFVFHNQKDLYFYCEGVLLANKRGASIIHTAESQSLGFLPGGAELDAQLLMEGVVRCVANNLCRSAEQMVRENIVRWSSKTVRVDELEAWINGDPRGLIAMAYAYKDLRAIADGELPANYFASKSTTGIQS